MLSFHKFSQADLKEMPALTLLCFGRASTIDFYHWKYYENSEGNVIGYVAKNEEGELVGYWGAIPDAYYINGKKNVMYLACDTMTHPNYRRMGIFEKLAALTCDELKRQGKSLAKVFPGEIPYSGYIKKLHWKGLGRIKPHFKISLQLKIEILLSKIIPSNPLFHFTDTDIISEAINDLDKVISMQFPIAKARDKSYLEWRFKDPSASHRIIYCYKNETLVGYCIYCIEKNLLLLIKDIYSLENDAYSMLFNKIYQITINNKLKGIYCWSNKNSFFSKLLKQRLFMKNPFNKGIMTYPFYFSVFENINVSPSNFITDIKNWNLLPIDYDG
ncbi:MAG: GNAT family N-acetyltransferase [Bacteroidetes bacterium]|nr:GNAT family N-acetyltransferase [Bacteroidota bacterium]